MTRARSGSCRGSTTAGVLLVLVMLALLAHGAIQRARYDGMATRASVVLLRERMGLAAGLDRGVAAARAAPALSTFAALSGTLGEVTYRVEGEAVGTETLLLTATATAAGRTRGSTSGRVLWALDPTARIAGLPAAFTAGGGVVGGGVTAASDIPTGGAWGLPADSCAGIEARIRAARPGTPLPTTAALDPSLFPDPGSAPGRSVPPLGLLTGPEILSRLPAHSSPALVLGTPSAFVAIGRDGSLEVGGGEGRGVLAVSGDLVLAGPVRFEGVALVGGDLTVGPGASLAGVAIVRGGVAVAVEGSAWARGCAALSALEMADALREPFALPWAAWLQPGG